MQPKNQVPGGATLPRTQSPAGEVTAARHGVSLQGVSKAFQGRPVLSDVGFEAEPGQFVALVGPSGAGKSTLLRLINGIHLPDAGTVTTLGRNPVDCSRGQLRDLRKRVGFVFQQFGLVGRLTAMENVLMGSLGQLRLPRYGIGSYPSELRRRAAENLERVGLIEQRFQRCDTLSGGQQQRVAIARTLMQQAEVVLADEPVASLDPAASLSVLSLLKSISAEDGLTVICSLHQVDLALQVSDRIIALRDGGKVLDRPTVDVDEATLRSIYSRDGHHG
jgi:phosphonate transport system ATP-binding protein